MGLKDEIRKIVQLQEIDTRVYALNRQKNKVLPDELTTVKENFEQRKQILSSFEEKVKEAQLKKKDKEIDLASKEENLLKYQGQLYQLKTNKEYQAKLSEIESLKADISLVEEDMLKIFDEIESEKSELVNQQSLLSKEEKTFKDKENEVLNQIKDADAQIKNLQDKRGILAKDIAKEVLSQYEQLLKTRGGLAIVPVKGHDCGACHLMVTHQKINEIKMYEHLVLCESCVRIFYIPEDIGEC